MINRVFHILWTIYACVMAIALVILTIVIAKSGIYVWPFQWVHIGYDWLFVSFWGALIMARLSKK